MTSAALRLKELRVRSGLSVRGLAALLEMDFSRYAYFEDPKRFKKPHLAMDFARSLARVLPDHGVDAAEVMALAGIEEDEATTPELSAGEEKLLGGFRTLEADQKTLLLQLVDTMQRAQGAPAGSTAVHTPQKSYAADTGAAR